MLRSGWARLMPLAHAVFGGELDRRHHRVGRDPDPVEALQVVGGALHDLEQGVARRLLQVDQREQLAQIRVRLQHHVEILVAGLQHRLGLVAT